MWHEIERVALIGEAEAGGARLGDLDKDGLRRQSAAQLDEQGGVGCFEPLFGLLEAAFDIAFPIGEPVHGRDGCEEGDGIAEAVIRRSPG